MIIRTYTLLVRILRTLGNMAERKIFNSDKKNFTSTNAPIKCFYCKREGHIRTNCFKWKAANKAKPVALDMADRGKIGDLGVGGGEALYFNAPEARLAGT